MMDGWNRTTLIERLTINWDFGLKSTSKSGSSEEQTNKMISLFKQLEEKLFTEMQHQIDASFLERFSKKDLKKGRYFCTRMECNSR